MENRKCLWLKEAFLLSPMLRSWKQVHMWDYYWNPWEHFYLPPSFAVLTLKNPLPVEDKWLKGLLGEYLCGFALFAFPNVCKGCPSPTERCEGCKSDTQCSAAENNGRC